MQFSVCDTFLEKRTTQIQIKFRDRRGHGHMDLQLHVQSVPITTKVFSSNLAHCKVYSKQHYVIKCVGDFLQVVRFPPPIKLAATM